MQTKHTSTTKHDIAMSLNTIRERKGETVPETVTPMIISRKAHQERKESAVLLENIDKRHDDIYLKVKGRRGERKKNKKKNASHAKM